MLESRRVSLASHSYVNLYGTEIWSSQTPGGTQNLFFITNTMVAKSNKAIKK
jgi:hypothetical protein